jgi:hypothetical protein
MELRTIGLVLLGAMALPAFGAAQTTPTPPAIARTVVASAKLPTVIDVPLHFKAVSVTLQPHAKSNVSAANGILPDVRDRPRSRSAAKPKYSTPERGCSWPAEGPPC